MANKEMNVRLKNRRDTLENWETKNPVLLNGETAYVVTNGGVRQKTGDGKTAFKSLPYDDIGIYQAVSALQTSQNGIASDVSALDSAVDAMASDVATAKTNASSALSKIDSKADASTVSALQTSVTGLSSQIATAQAEVDAVEQTVSNHATSIAALQKTPPSHTHTTASITGLDSTIQGLEGDIADAAATAVTALNTANSKAASDHTHTLSALGAASATHEHAIGDVTNLSTTISGLESSIASAASTANSALTTANGKANSSHTHTPAAIGAAATVHTHAIADVTNLQSTLNTLSSDVSSLEGVTTSLQTQVNQKMNDYSIELYNGTGGNPKPVRFATVNYSTCGSENGVAIKIGMVSGHGNGVSYAFLQDAIIRVSYLGGVEVDNFKYYGAEASAYDGAIRQYGDIFWVVDPANKIVDFYCLMGQYSRVYQTPWKRLTSSSGGVVTQHTSVSVYSSGEIVWAHNSEYALKSDVADDSSVSALEASVSSLNTQLAEVKATANSALTTANGKADASHTHTLASIGAAATTHTHAITNVTNLESTLSTITGNVSTHTANTTSHLTAAERTNWNAAYSHATAAHAPSGAEVNQNAFSNIKVGTVTIAADSKTDTLTIAAGTNIQLAGDANNDVVTISAMDTTYGSATTSADGLMTAAMVAKLNGIASNANNYSLPTASSSTLGGVKTTSTVTSTSGYIACPIIGGVPYYRDTDTTYSLGSFGITATAAELNYMDGVTSNVQTQLNGKAPTNELSALRAQVDSVSSQAAAAHSKANSAYDLVDSKADVNHTHNDLKPFVATYGVTKFSDILAAHNAGQIVMMTSLNTSSYLASSSVSAAVVGNVSSNSATFDFAFVDNFGRAVRVTNKVDSNNTWSNLYTATPSLNRTTNLNASDTNYTTLMARGTSLNASDTTPAVNGAIAWTYE